MQSLSRHDAGILLSSIGLKIGAWNELTKTVGTESHKAYRPSSEALALYAFTQKIFNWLSPLGWTLLQIDNSTSPADDEIKIFKQLILKGQQWNINDQRSFLFSSLSAEFIEENHTALILVMFFSLLFEWHAHIVCENSKHGKRISLQDGVVFFFGDASEINSADLLISQNIKAPLRVPQQPSGS